MYICKLSNYSILCFRYTSFGLLFKMFIYNYCFTYIPYIYIFPSFSFSFRLLSLVGVCRLTRSPCYLCVYFFTLVNG
jgi:hypothetical protein